MLERAKNVIRLVSEWWGQAGRMQRLFAAGTALLLVLSVGVTLYLNRPQYVAVELGQSPGEVTAMLSKLAEMQVPYRLGAGGTTVLVPADQRLTAGLAVTQSGLPASGAVGLELFSEPKFGATDFERRINFLRAQQGELERAILRMEKVAYANVKVALPEPSPFVREEKPVTAAVLVQTRPGQTLNQQDVQGIVNFLSRAVQGLKPDHVTVVDQLGRTLTGDAGEGGLASAQTMEQEQFRLGIQRELQTRVQRILEPLFGPGNVVAQVNVRLSTEESRVESRTVLPGAPVTEQTVRETGGRPTGSADGPPVYQGAPGAAAADLFKAQTSTQYQLSERREVTASRPGSIRDISIGLAINRSDLAPEQVRQVQEMVAAAVGSLPERITVTPMPFSVPVRTESPLAAVGTGTSTAAQPAPVDWLVGVLGAALLVVAVLPKLRRKSQPVLAGAALAVAPGPRSPAASASSQRLRAAMAAEPAPPPPESPEAKLQKEVSHLIEDNPEVSATMLRSWLRG